MNEDQYDRVINLITNDNIVKNKHGKNTYAALVDFSLNADEHRFFLVDLKQEKIIYSGFTSHGQGSGTVLKATDFSNVPESHKSSLGVMKTSETYQSAKVGFALKLHGLEIGKNENVFKRGIVIHAGDYVTAEYVKKNKFAGRSHGCVVLDPKVYKDIIEKLKGGSIVYIVK